MSTNHKREEDMIDCHVHTHENVNHKNELLERLSVIGAKGAIVISLPPDNFYNFTPDYTFQERIEHIKKCCDGAQYLFPFFWLDPTSADAEEQVEMCCNQDIKGFKVICDHFYPSNKRAMQTFRLIAGKGKPVLFHSGILWDGKVSSKYNRPVEFECLLEVPGLRFAMAHISWPWCDELLAMYGKFQRQKSMYPDTASEMFIDTTPGTPPVYRAAELSKLYSIGYDLENNLMFGTDGNADDYCSEWSEKLMQSDKDILRSLDLDDEKTDKYFSKNTERFVHGC